MTHIGSKPPDGPSSNTPNDPLSPTRFAEIDAKGNIVYPLDGVVIDPRTGVQFAANDTGHRLQQSLRLHAGDATTDDVLHHKYPDAPNFNLLMRLSELLHSDRANEIARRRLTQARQEIVAKIESWSRRVAEAIETLEPFVESQSEDDAELRRSVQLGIQEPDERALRPEERKFYDYLRIIRPAFDSDVPEAKYAMLDLAAHIVERLWHKRAPSELKEHARVIASECMRAIDEQAARPNDHSLTFDMASLLVRTMSALPVYKREEPLLAAATVLREEMAAQRATCISAIFHYKQLAHWFCALEEDELRTGECAAALRALTPLTQASDPATRDAAQSTLGLLRDTYPVLMQRAENAPQSYALPPATTTPVPASPMAKVIPLFGSR